MGEAEHHDHVRVRVVDHRVPGPGRDVKRVPGRKADLAVGSGARQPSRVKVYRGTDLSGTAEPAAVTLDPFGTVTTSGVFVG